MADNDWWFDLKTKTPVQDSKAGRASDRLGPYPTREEAERALEKVEDATRRRRPAGTTHHDPRVDETCGCAPQPYAVNSAHSPASRLPPGGFVTLDPTTVATRTVEVGCDFVHQSAFDVATVFQVEPVGDQPAEMISSAGPST